MIASISHLRRQRLIRRNLKKKQNEKTTLLARKIKKTKTKTNKHHFQIWKLELFPLGRTLSIGGFIINNNWNNCFHILPSVRNLFTLWTQSTGALHVLLRCWVGLVLQRSAFGCRSSSRWRRLHQWDLLLHWWGGVCCSCAGTGRRVLNRGGGGRRPAAEAVGYLLKGLAPGLGHFEEGEDDEDDEESSEDEEDPWPTQFLGRIEMGNNV